MGELIRAQKETVGLNRGGGTGANQHRAASASRELAATPTLAEAGIDRKLSSRAQKLSAIPEAEFVGLLGEWRERIGRENERITTNLLRAVEVSSSIALITRRHVAAPSRSPETTGLAEPLETAH